jgi:tetratricopeptide (TPR) repeat protein
VYDDLEKTIGPTTEIARRRHSLYLGLGDFKRAAGEYEELVERFPGNPEYLLQLAAFYEQIDDRKAALETYRRVLEIDPDHPKATLVVAGESAPNSNEAEYINTLKPIFEDPTIQIDLKVGKILPLLQQLNDKPDAALAEQLLQLTDILERVHGDDAKSYAAAGDILIAVNRYGEAADKFILALDYDDTIFQIWEQLQYALLLAGDAKQLAKYSEYAMDVFPNQSQNYYHAALGYLGISDPMEALSLLEQALLMSAGDKGMQQNVISAIGLVYTLDGNAAEAKDAFDKALEINPNAALAQTRFAYYLLQNGGVDEAVKTLRGLEKLGSGQAIFVETKALAGLKTEQYGSAVQEMNSFLAQGGHLFPRALELYGDLLFLNGQLEEALEAWNQALEGGSKSRTLKQKIANKKM